MSKKFITIILISHLVAIVVGVYGGMKYGQSQSLRSRLARENFSASGGSAFGGQNLQNLSPEQQQQMAQRFGNGFGGRNTNNAINGEIISKDNQSITIKLRDGGSKIIFFSESTKISKSADGTIDDLAVGKNVMVDGTANQDGSITAQNVRINNQPVINPMVNQPQP